MRSMQWLKKFFLFFLLGFSTLSCTNIAAPAVDFGPRVSADQVKGRQIYVYTPPDYQTSSERYPVVYMYDGQTAFAGGLVIDKILEALVRDGKVQSMIIVGIVSSAERTSECVPYEDQWIRDNWGPYQPKAKEFGNFIVNEIVPYVDQHYRTIPDRDNRAIMGYSLGGLLAMWMSFEHDTVFSMAAGLSPSLWVANYKFIADATQIPRKNLKLWYDVGTLEWEYYVPLISVLRGKGYVYGKDVAYYEDEGGRHDNLSWIARLPYPLILFKGKQAMKRMNFQIHTEVIKSAVTPGKYFLRLNPVVDMDNGLRYSLATTAQYTLLNPNDGKVNSDGSFHFVSTNDLTVLIEYEDIKQTVVIRYNEIESRK